MDSKSKCKKIEKKIQIKPSQQPHCSDATNPDDEKSEVLFSTKLTELKSSLNSTSISSTKTSLFKPNFIDSLIYVIRSEHKTQLDFNKHIESNDFEWSQLNNALNEIKRICKQKNDLILFLNKMSISNDAKMTLSISSSSSNINNAYSDDSNSCCSTTPDRIELTNELENEQDC